VAYRTTNLVHHPLSIITTTLDKHPPEQVLCTHKHWDHSGGNEEMARLVPGIEVVTTSYEDIPAATRRLKDGESYRLGTLDVKALYTPCHTR
jgi:hydroxyacylglutathione hydrolase